MRGHELGRQAAPVGVATVHDGRRGAQRPVRSELRGADAVSASIKAVTGRDTTASTTGGTSDGRFIATLGTQVVELGPVNATIHQVNERVLASDLDLLSEIYYQTLVRLLA